MVKRGGVVVTMLPAAAAVPRHDAPHRALDTPSMRLTSSAFPASPPQPLCPGAQTSANCWSLRRTAIGGVTELWHLSRLGVARA